jgi:5-hydroxyisourate hydrolase
MAARDPITCHVLDTVAGRPAANIAVSLKCTSDETVFTATTNSDGRVANWTAAAGTKVEEVLSAAVSTQGGVSVWKLTFETGVYYGEGKTFWPQVDLSFYVNEGEHYHVPLLLGPYSFTTYRGS